VTLHVDDSRGVAVSDAQVTDLSGQLLGRSDGQGIASFPCARPCHVRVTAKGFAAQTVAVNDAATVRLQPATSVQEVTVTAYRTPLSTLESPVTTRQLTQSALQSTAAVTLDGKLRQLPGVELFRRSSSLVANPTSQGISMRGLGSTAASRTLVTEDDVPLNDPLGGWIEWNETPELAIRSVEAVRGGASDLYGSSAIGGVINVIPVEPQSNAVEVTSSYGSEATFDQGLVAQMKHGAWGVLGAGGLIGTDGYIQEAPWQRGPVDQPSNVHSQNALVDLEHVRGPLRLFGRTTAFNEWRHNGTIYQQNGTRLLRYETGGDWQNPAGQTAALRFYGSDERYRQTFSGISDQPIFGDPKCSFRCGETPAKYSFVPINQVGAAAHWSAPLGAGFLIVAGADVRDVRVWDQEHLFSGGGSLARIDDHQRDSGAYAEAMWVHRGWTVTAAGRMDWFQNFNVHQYAWAGNFWKPSSTQLPQFDERLFDPRVGIARKLGDHWALTASGFRAFRAPTPSELYRSVQIGDVLTKANGNLSSERATGWEAGIASERRWGTVRASYFLTQVNRPITSFTLVTKPTSIIRERENLGQIESKGVSLDFSAMPLSWLEVDGGYQYAHAVVSRGPQDYGNWIPEVARNMGALNARASRPGWGTLALETRMSGRMYDDDANQFPLRGYYRIDAYASHQFGERWEMFAAGENLTDRTIEVSKTPYTTLDNGRVGRIGLRLRLGAVNR
jgi:outer membrane receptor protein involved in Fe transport